MFCRQLNCLLLAALCLAPYGSYAADTDSNGDAQIIIDGKPLNQWIETQKKTGKLLSDDNASRIGVIENDGGELMNVKRRTVIHDSVVIPTPKENRTD